MPLQQVKVSPTNTQGLIHMNAHDQSEVLPINVVVHLYLTIMSYHQQLRVSFKKHQVQCRRSLSRAHIQILLKNGVAKFQD